jgi:FixJ family two-component response regulator
LKNLSKHHDHTQQFFSAALALENWDVILADYSLPYFRGYEALEQWKKSGSAVPLIFVSGMMSPEVAIGAMKAGAHDYINKNNLDLIVTAVERELGRTEDRRRLNAALKSASDEMEKQIQERTRELQTMNVSLTMEIAKHRAFQANIRGYLLCLVSLREVAEEAALPLDLQSVMKQVLEKLEFVLPQTLGAIRLVNGTGEMENLACRNIDEAIWRDAKWQTVDDDFAKLVWESKTPVVVSKLENYPRKPNAEFLRGEGYASYLGLPLVARRKALGVISFYSRDEREFSDDEVQFLSALADQAATAIYNAQPHDRH